jgi:hypothetical protein
MHRMLMRREMRKLAVATQRGHRWNEKLPARKSGGLYKT